MDAYKTNSYHQVQYQQSCATSLESTGNNMSTISSDDTSQQRIRPDNTTYSGHKSTRPDRWPESSSSSCRTGDRRECIWRTLRPTVGTGTPAGKQPELGPGPCNTWRDLLACQSCCYCLFVKQKTKEGIFAFSTSSMTAKQA